MRLLLARHGETRHNAARRIQGPLLDAPLNARGFAQAQDLAGRVVDAARVAEARVAAVYASPLRRARQTALACASALKLPLAGALPAFREFSWGELDGKVLEGEAAARFQDLVARWRAGETGARPPGGDSPEWVWSRVRDALARLAAAHDGETVLVVAHARVNMIALAGLAGDLSRMEEHDMATGSLVEVDVPLDTPLGPPLNVLEPEGASDARGASDVQRARAVPEPRRL